MSIRPFRETDYQSATALWNSIYPHNQLASGELRERDARRAAHLRFQRFAVDGEAGLLAYGHYDQRPDEYHPHKFLLFVCAAESTPWSVREALGRHLLAALQPYDPLAVYAIAREDMPNTRLYQELGFSEAGRVWESRLDPTTLDPAQVGAAVAAVERQGYRLRSLRDLAADPQRDRKLYALVTELERDVPRHEPYTPPEFATFQQEVLAHPDMLPEAYLVACQGEAYVGVSSVWQRAGNDYLETDLTGVRREHRRRGLARALKLAALAMAAGRGQVVKTWNDAQNDAILALNAQVHFVREPAWIDFVKHYAGAG